MANAAQYADHSDIDDSGINDATLQTGQTAQDQYALQLQQAGVRGELGKLREVAAEFDNDVHTLNLLAAYLKRWYAGRLNGLEAIPVLLDGSTPGQGLRRILAAFEIRLRGTSDMTLLYLLALSDRPVAQQHVQMVFRSSFMERWLTKRDDYVRFLAPLGRLNDEHWHWVIENLRRLHLLEAPIPRQHDLLVVAEPVRTYFRNKLQLRNQTVFRQGLADMEKLSRDTVVEFRQRYRKAPEIKSMISSQLQQQLEAEAHADEAAAAAKAKAQEPVHWRHEELDTAQTQLAALRKSLALLKTHTQQLANQLNDTPAEPDPAADKLK